ncbi:MAG: beta strand repeat-containing protein, partial [Planctomycetota bacterium]
YDSDNIAAAPANEITAASSFDGGNNINWNISGSANFKTWVGGDPGSESSWNTGNNWNPVGTPGTGATIVVPSSATYMPVVDIPSVTITNLTIQTGASLDTGGNSMTITGNYENSGILYRQGGDFVNQTDTDSGTVVYRISGGAIQNYGEPNADYYSLKLNGESFTISGGLKANNDLIFESGGTLSPGSYSLIVEGDVSGSGSLIAGASTVDINGSILISDYAATGGTTFVAGSWDPASFTHNNGTVVFDGAGIIGGNAFYNMQINAGTRTATGPLNIENDFSILGGTLDADGSTITIGGNWNNSGSFIHGFNNVVFNDPGKVTVISGDSTFYNFTSSTPEKTIQFTAGDTQTIDGTFLIQGSLGNLITLESTNSGVSWNMVNTGDAEDVDYAAVQRSNNTGPNITANETVDNGNNVNWTINLTQRTWVGGTGGSETSWNTAGNWNPAGIPVAGDSLVIPSSATYMPVLDIASVTVKGINIQSGATLDTAGNSITITDSFENQGILYRQGGDVVSRTDSDSGLVVYKTSGGTIQANYTGPDYYRIQLDETGQTFTLISDLDVADDLILTAGTFDAGAWAINISGNWSVTAGAVFNAGTGTITFNGSGPQALVSGGSSFNNITKQGNSRLSVSTNDLSILGTLIISGSSDIVSLTDRNFSIGTIVNNGTLELDGTQLTQSITTMDTDSGLVLYNGAAGGSLYLSNFYDLMISRSTKTFFLNSAIDVNGDLFIDAGSLNANNNNITVAGGWANSDSFLPGTGTVIFDDALKTTIISGNTAFYNFTSSTPGKIIQFEAGSTQT